MRLVGALIVLAVVASGAPPASAEHEVSYRYTVLGYVKDAKGRPVSDRTVQVVRDKTGLSYTTETDATGLYVLVIRLGDDGVGESLSLDLGGIRSRLTAQFDVNNQVDERGTRVDLEGTRVLPRPAWFHSTLTRLLAPVAR